MIYIFAEFAVVSHGVPDIWSSAEVNCSRFARGHVYLNLTTFTKCLCFRIVINLTENSIDAVTSLFRYRKIMLILKI